MKKWKVICAQRECGNVGELKVWSDIDAVWTGFNGVGIPTPQVMPAIVLATCHRCDHKGAAVSLIESP